MLSDSYGHAYLTSYGWAGSGTGLRKGAIDKPLTIRPKKNLNGLGKDRDEAFPFWDHLFTAASKAIKIKVSSDDEDADGTEDPSHTNSDSVQFRRTTTGILSNRRPTYGTPTSTSGSATPNPDIGAGIPAPNQSLSLLATAKREAVKRGLYSRFFRGPVLGPDGDPTLTPASSEPPPVPTAVPAHVDDQDNAFGGLKKDKKRRSENKAETKEERKERKILKKERRAARAAKKAGKRKKDRLDNIDRRARQDQDKVIRSEEKGGEQSRKSVADAEGDDLQPARCTQKRLGKEFTPSDNGQQDTSRASSGTSVGATDALDVACMTKKRKRKDTLP